MSPLGGFAGDAHEGLRALARLTDAGETAGLFLPAPLAAAPAGWTVVAQGPLLQMTHEKDAPPAAGDRPLLELGEADAKEMLALAELTKPGPFSLRTRELGAFLGVREGGRLAAMTGERLRLPGWTEVSAVCTHPEHLGRGHAAALMAETVRRIRARGEKAFLHVLPRNERAIALYERLGFARRTELVYAILRRLPNA